MSLQNLNTLFRETARICENMALTNVEFTNSFKETLSSFVERNHSFGYSKIIFDRGTVILYSGEKVSFIPTVGFVIAKTLLPYYKLLLDYKRECSELLGSSFTNENIKKLKDGSDTGILNVLKKKIPDETSFQHIQDFLTNYESWGGGKTIDRGDFFCSPLMKAAKLQAETQSAIAELTQLFNDNPALVAALEYTQEHENADNFHRVLLNNKHPKNRIFFGAPGTGKSHQLNVEAEQSFSEKNVDRVTFYPNYSYAQFVGTYKPITRKNGEIAYAYVPGPLMRQWIRAMQNPAIPVLLIVEELNRANAPAVFGDMFQLLDRKNGISEYSVATSEDLRKYLQSIVSADNHASGDKSDWEWLPSNTQIDNIRLPSNLFIWTTMNSADQGVFPLDTAFKRRWDNTYIGIDEKSDVIAKCNFHFANGLYNWNEFRMKINFLLTTSRVNEDKLLGPFFLNPMGLSDDEFSSKFKSKVLMYLYEDAARQCRNSVFAEDENKNQRTYSQICSTFDKIGAGVFKNIELSPVLESIDQKSMAEQNNE